MPPYLSTIFSAFLSALPLRYHNCLLLRRSDSTKWKNAIFPATSSSIAAVWISGRKSKDLAVPYINVTNYHFLLLLLAFAFAASASLVKADLVLVA